MSESLEVKSAEIKILFPKKEATVLFHVASSKRKNSFKLYNNSGEIIEDTGNKTITPYGRVGKLHYFVSDTAPNFRINPPRHYISLSNSDPRIKFPALSSKLLCDGNFDGFSKLFFDLVADPETFQFVHQYDGAQNPFGPNNRVIIGLQPFVDLYCKLIESAPDTVSEIRDVLGYYDKESGTNVFYLCFIYFTTN